MVRLIVITETFKPIQIFYIFKNEMASLCEFNKRFLVADDDKKNIFENIYIHNYMQSTHVCNDIKERFILKQYHTQSLISDKINIPNKNAEILYLKEFYFFALLKELKNSSIYRNFFRKHFKNKVRKHQSKRPPSIYTILFYFIHNVSNAIDYKWNYRCIRLVNERMHLDTAMSWLSTLGGGFSALGDYNLHFANKAGNVSFKQMIIASQLQDENLISRCWLYFALSLIQKGKYKKAAKIIRYEYIWINSQPFAKTDHRLINMCKGIWSKLKYEHQMHKVNSLSRRL